MIKCDVSLRSILDWVVNFEIGSQKTEFFFLEDTIPLVRVRIVILGLRRLTVIILSECTLSIEVKRKGHKELSRKVLYTKVIDKRK